MEGGAVQISNDAPKRGRECPTVILRRGDQCCRQRTIVI